MNTTVSDQLFKLLKLGCNPNSQRVDGNTCLHISTINGHVESVAVMNKSASNIIFSWRRCIRYLLQFGANPYLENNLGKTSWHNLSQLDETIELECLHEFVDHDLNLVILAIFSKLSLFCIFY
jgi:ankyrin repeat protein